MSILKWFFKLLALPFLLALTLLFWAGVFVTSFSAVVFNLLACLCFFMAVAVLLFGLASGAEALRTLLVGFCVFLVPVVAQWLLVKIALLKEVVRDFIYS